MKKQTRIIRDDRSKKNAIDILEEIKEYPFLLEWGDAKNPRSIAQNRTQRKWIGEISQQTYDDKESVRAYCKLHFGVPILRNEDEDYKRQYDMSVRPLDYEVKLEIMKVPIDFPVTRRMTTKQHAQYLDMIYEHFTSQGVILTDPNLQGIE